MRKMCYNANRYKGENKMKKDKLISEIKNVLISDEVIVESVRFDIAYNLSNELGKLEAMRVAHLSTDIELLNNKVLLKVFKVISKYKDIGKISDYFDPDYEKFLDTTSFFLPYVTELKKDVYLTYGDIVWLKSIFNFKCRTDYGNHYPTVRDLKSGKYPIPTMKIQCNGMVEVINDKISITSDRFELINDNVR